MILIITVSLVVLLFFAMGAAIFVPKFRAEGSGMVTAIGVILAAPVTTYIGLRFTREMRATSPDEEGEDR